MFLLLLHSQVHAQEKPNTTNNPVPDSLQLKDTDSDGVKDDVDKCINEKGPASNFGCPDNGIYDPFIPPDSLMVWEKRQKDTDGDGVKDDIDKCLEEKGPASNFGCPLLIAHSNALRPQKKYIFFAGRSSGISPGSVKLLKNIAQILKENPTYTIYLDGHTDNVGDHDLNMKLSMKRAEAAKSFLISAGVEKSQMTWDGHGPDKPIDTNKTKAGRAKNNRVEISLNMN
jgi:outer membrane protein OmpA-like peptidoglycan-associated protein